MSLPRAAGRRHAPKRCAPTACRARRRQPVARAPVDTAGGMIHNGTMLPMRLTPLAAALALLLVSGAAAALLAQEAEPVVEVYKSPT